MLGALILGYRFFAAPGVGVEPKSAAVEPAPPVLPEKAMTVAEKKQRFRELLVPPVDRVYRRLQRQFDLTAMLLASGAEPATVTALKQQYRVSSDSDLLAALKPHPRSVALAQAALESSWATSRFFNEANNVFGVWSFNADEPRIAAGERRGSKTIWLKKYASIEASVADYYRVLALGRAYGEFRSQRLGSDNPYDLLSKLDSYSEKGSAYGRALSSVLSYNKFANYDETFYAFQASGLSAQLAAEKGLAADRAEIAAAARGALNSIYSVVSLVDLQALATLDQPTATSEMPATVAAVPAGAIVTAPVAASEVDATGVSPQVADRSRRPAGNVAPIAVSQLSSIQVEE